METDYRKMTLPQLRAEFKAVSRERDQIHESTAVVREQCGQLERDNQAWVERVTWVARNLLCERQELQTRIDRINLMLVRLGFPEQAGFQKAQGGKG